MADKKPEKNDDDFEFLIDEIVEPTDKETVKESEKEIKDGVPLVENKERWDALTRKKKEMKDTPYRRKYDKILDQIDKELIDTENYNSATGTVGPNIVYFQQQDGNYNYTPMIGGNQSTITSTMPIVKKPYVFGKVKIATSLLGSKLPNADFSSDDMVFAKTYYELWKRTWELESGNGMPSWQAFVQNTATTGFGAYKTFYKRVETPVKSNDFSVLRIRHDDIYRLSIDPRRIWVGVAHKNADYFSKFEYLYEIDTSIEDIVTRLRALGVEKINRKKLNLVLEDEGKKYTEKEATHATLTFYENEMTNTLSIMCGCYELYNGELESPDGYASISTANFFTKDETDPYGVGLWELGRGSSSIMNHINSLVPEQIESEIAPIIFEIGGSTTNGTRTYSRGSGIVNTVNAGSELQIERTTGNPSGAIGFVQNEKASLDEITSLPEVLSGLGSETTLGATVIVKEAALQGLSIPRNSIIGAFKRDAYVACSYFKEHYSAKRVFSFPTNDAVQTFIESNPSYFSEEVPELSSEGNVVVQSSPKIKLPFYLNIDSGSEEGYVFEDTETVYNRDELMIRLQSTNEDNQLSRVLMITVDPTSLLEPSEELTRQKIAALAPQIDAMTEKALMIAQQDPTLGKVKLMQLMAFLKSMKIDPFEWLPKEVIQQVMQGQMVNPQMQQLAMANQMSSAAEQMQKVGMPQGQSVQPGQPVQLAQQETQMNNLPQEINPVQDNMGDSYNASMGKMNTSLS